ncbi:MAG: SDR family NAD(P)-dependent oxidoreductase, partial [Deltaproteobacteria bacterium]|nr:SDR family NAD(P)-dependent oxidoreductase [Deltaproteobacteria bacterium]
MKEMRGRVAVITGAASGIGRGMAEAFAGAEMKVMLSDVRAEALDAAAKALRDQGATVESVVAGSVIH